MNCVWSNVFDGHFHRERSPVGVFLAGWVYAVFRVAAIFEGSFTTRIYAEKTNTSSTAKMNKKKNE